MSRHPCDAIHEQLLDYLSGAPSVTPRPARLPVRSEGTLTGEKLLELFESQLMSRSVDFEARHLRARNQGFYTIGSSGHEGNAAVADHLRRDDPCFLHYRSGAFMMQRARLDPEHDEFQDAILSLTATSLDPVSGGRHKVWGSRPLWTPPQTSTIASHLPKAVGAAVAIDRGHRLKLGLPVPRDAIAVVSFGDASLNHSTSQGALNSAAWLSTQNVPVPILMVCEDNGLGISVPTPDGWVESRMRGHPGFRYFRADGLDLVDAWEVAAEAVEHCRTRRRPTFLHLRTVRLLGHAGSDVEHTYRSQAEIEATWAQDPVLATARILVEAGIATPEELRDLYLATLEKGARHSARAATCPRLSTLEEVVRPLAPFHPEAVAARARGPSGEKTPKSLADAKPLPLGPTINRALREALAEYPEALVFGEDVAKKGGVYGVTAGLLKDFGPGRVFNTLLDETAILGMAIGAAHLGFLPIPEIQYLAYLHNALDQLRSEACSLQFFSDDQFRNPMVVRIAGYGYQKGFGGHFHNDNSLGALRDIPGLVVCSPSRPEDAPKLLRTCLALAKEDGRVVAFVEPIALYPMKDLHTDGDGGWMAPYPERSETVAVGEVGIHHPEARDLLVVTYANGLHLSLQAARILAEKHGIRARVLDLRWLSPLPHDRVAEHAAACGRVLVVDECRRNGGLGEAVVAGLVERIGSGARISMVTGADTYLPLGPAMDLALPSRDRIVAAAVTLCEDRARGEARGA